MKMYCKFVLYTALSAALAVSVDSRLLIWGDTEPSVRGEFPHYVEVFGSCGGSLIAPDVVLTAAHCMQAMKGDVLKTSKEKLLKKNNWVLVGAMKSEKAKQGAKWRKVIDFTYHPKMPKKTLVGRDYIDYDVILLRLNKPYEPKNTSVKLRLNMDDDVPQVGDKLTVCGLGEGDFPNDAENKNPKGGFVDYLHDAEAPYKYTNKICNSNKRAEDGVKMWNGVITDRQMCWSRCWEDGEVCAGKGDSGGPVVKKLADNVHLQVGVVSRGSDSGKYPDILARVSIFCEFIQDVVCNKWESLPSKSYLCKNTCKSNKSINEDTLEVFS